MNSQLVWIEIRTKNFIKTVEFYEHVLDITFEIRHLYNNKIAVFDEEIFKLRGCIIESKETFTKNSVILFFKVAEIGKVLARVLESGGTIITSPSLVKQHDRNGKEIIGKNLFDDEVGYLAEANDPDGNTFFLYANN